MSFSEAVLFTPSEGATAITLSGATSFTLSETTSFTLSGATPLRFSEERAGEVNRSEAGIPPLLTPSEALSVNFSEDDTITSEGGTTVAARTSASFVTSPWTVGTSFTSESFILSTVFISMRTFSCSSAAMILSVFFAVVYSSPIASAAHVSSPANEEVHGNAPNADGAEKGNDHDPDRIDGSEVVEQGTHHRVPTHTTHDPSSTHSPHAAHHQRTDCSRRHVGTLSERNGHHCRSKNGREGNHGAGSDTNTRLTHVATHENRK